MQCTFITDDLNGPDQYKAQVGKLRFCETREVSWVLFQNAGHIVDPCAACAYIKKSGQEHCVLIVLKQTVKQYCPFRKKM
jgi:hypothetical protein